MKTLRILLLTTLICGLVLINTSSAMAELNTPITAKSAGDVIKFGGHEWIILKPSTGYVLSKGPYNFTLCPNNINFDYGGNWRFDPSDSNNIGYFLNSNNPWEPQPGISPAYNSFYSRLTDKHYILTKSWTTGNELNESEYSVTAQIGLLSKSEYEAYKGSVLPPDGNGYTWWLRTIASVNPYPYAQSWAVISNGIADDIYINGTAYVRPALYLRTDLYVDSAGRVTDKAESNTPTTGVTLNLTALNLEETKTVTLTATVSPEDASNKNVTWSSSNTSIATVSSSGVVTAVAQGSATITVTTEDGGKTATCSVTVNSATVPVTGVTLNKTSTTITVGSTETLTATVSPSNATNKNVTWISSNTSIATVSSSGKVSAVAQGSATITVTTEDGGKTATCSVTVNPGTQSSESIMYIVPANINFTIYMLGEFSGTDTWTVPGDSNTYTNKVTVTPSTGQGYTTITGIFDSPGPKYGSIGTDGIKVNFYVVSAPTTQYVVKVRFID